MPVSEYYKGSGRKVMRSMNKTYGPETGKRVFYATANKTGMKPSEDIGPIKPHKHEYSDELNWGKYKCLHCPKTITQERREHMIRAGRNQRSIAAKRKEERTRDYERNDDDMTPQPIPCDAMPKPIRSGDRRTRDADKTPTPRMTVMKSNNQQEAEQRAAKARSQGYKNVTIKQDGGKFVVRCDDPLYPSSPQAKLHAQLKGGTDAEQPHVDAYQQAATYANTLSDKAHKATAMVNTTRAGHSGAFTSHINASMAHANASNLAKKAGFPLHAHNHTLAAQRHTLQADNYTGNATRATDAAAYNVIRDAAMGRARDHAHRVLDAIYLATAFDMTEGGKLTGMDDRELSRAIVTINNGMIFTGITRVNRDQYIGRSGGQINWFHANEVKEVK